jgi:protein TonB
VVVHALVGKDGRVVDARVDARRSIPLLNESALAAARRWVFKPALANGHPVAVWVAIPMRFSLH